MFLPRYCGAYFFLYTCTGQVFFFFVGPCESSVFFFLPCLGSPSDFKPIPPAKHAHYNNRWLVDNLMSTLSSPNMGQRHAQWKCEDLPLFLTYSWDNRVCNEWYQGQRVWLTPVSRCEMHSLISCCVLVRLNNRFARIIKLVHLSCTVCMYLNLIL